MIYEAFLAGTWAAVGSTFGKMSGTPSIVDDSYVLWATLLVSMVVINTWGCRYYLRSLDAASNSAAPTVVSSASSYVLSVSFATSAVNDLGGGRMLDKAISGVYDDNPGMDEYIYGIIGIILFNEGATTWWWFGAMLIIIGLTLIARPRNKIKGN